MEAAERLIVALDVPNGDEAVDLVDLLRGHVGAFKVGLQLYTAEGPEIVYSIASRGERVFLDLKLHDIPNTMAGAAAAATKLGVWMLTVHVAAGEAALCAVRSAVAEEAEAEGHPAPLIVGVTVLTSIDADTMASCIAPGSPFTLEELVTERAEVAARCGLDGVVASPLDVARIRQALGDRLTIVTPGVRPAGADALDQKRPATPSSAISAGASYLVVGRPITRASDPRGVADAIAREIDDALEAK